MKKYLGKYTSKYYENNKQDGDRIALEMYWKMFKRFIPNKGNILDFGAGNGYLSKRIAKDNSSYALEISEFAKKNIKINSPKTKLLDSENKINDNYFEGIISLHTLEHVVNPENTVKKLSKALKQDGKFFIVVPNPDGLGHKFKKNNWFGFRDKTHCSLLTSKRWKEIIEGNNLQIIKTSSDGFWDVPYVKWIPNIIQKLLFFPSCLLLVIFRRMIYPEWFGECLIILARKN
jgi:SAM-dependent methyltransferase